MRKRTIAALVVTGIIMFMFCVSAYFTYNGKNDILQDMMCEKSYTGEVCISTKSISNNKDNIIGNDKILVHRINKILNEKYPKENIIRENPESDSIEEIEEEPDEHHSA